MVLKAVLFDMGDTLVHAKPKGRWVRLEQVVSIISKGNQELSKMLKRTIEIQRERYNESLVTLEEVRIQDSLDQAVTECGASVTPLEQQIILTETMDYLGTRMALYADAISTLAHLSSLGLKLGIVSNVSFAGKHYEKLFEQWGIKHYFGGFAWSSDVGKRKPHPDIFHEALELLNIDPACAIHVGDLLVPDILGAHRAGLMGAAWINRGDPPERPLSSGRAGKTDPPVLPDWTIQELSELIPIVEQLLKSA